MSVEDLCVRLQLWHILSFCFKLDSFLTYSKTCIFWHALYFVNFATLAPLLK